MLALIHFYFGEEPKDLDRIAKLWCRLQYALQFDGKMKKEKIKLVS